MPVFQLQGSGPSENSNDDSDQALVLEDFVNHALKILKGAFSYLDHVALLEVDIEGGQLFGLIGLDQHLFDVGVPHGSGLAHSPDEVAHTDGFLYHEPRPFGDAAVLFQGHLHEYVPRIELALLDALLSGLDSFDPLAGDEDAADDIVQALDFDFFLDCDCLSQVDIGYVLGLEVFGIPRYSRLKFQERIKSGDIGVTEWTNAAMAWRHKAGEMGVPFLAVRNMMGTETFKRSAAKLSKCPFTGSSVVLLPALFPDVSVVHVQRSDIYGNAQIDGMTNIDISAIKSSKRVILTTEEIIPHEEIRDHPEQTQIPYFYVDAVVHIPYGGHPSNCPKRYYADVKYIREYVDASSDPTGKKVFDFHQEYIFSVDDFEEYLKKIGSDRLKDLERLEASI